MSEPVNTPRMSVAFRTYLFVEGILLNAEQDHNEAEEARSIMDAVWKLLGEAEQRYLDSRGLLPLRQKAGGNPWTPNRDFPGKPVTPNRNTPCADCNHAYESHDYNGCLCWINADALRRCPCRAWRSH